MRTDKRKVDAGTIGISILFAEHRFSYDQIGQCTRCGAWKSTDYSEIYRKIAAIVRHIFRYTFVIKLPRRDILVIKFFIVLRDNAGFI